MSRKRIDYRALSYFNVITDQGFSYRLDWGILPNSIMLLVFLVSTTYANVYKIL